MLEAAIITPLLLLLTFSIVDFGALFYVYLALRERRQPGDALRRHRQRDGRSDRPGTPLSRDDSIKTAMRQATPTLTIDDGAFTFSHLPPGGGAWVGGVGGPSEIEKVTVNYTWTLLSPVLRPFFPNGQINLTVESVMKNEGEVPMTRTSSPELGRAAASAWSSSRSCCRSSW